VQKASFNYSGSRFSPVMAHVNASVDHVERHLMTPDEVLRLKPPEKKAERGGSERIVGPGQMLIFVSGHHPIVGTQILYFLDPVLAARGITPAEELRDIGRRSTRPTETAGSDAEQNQQT
jgi:type IV secretion system protein VirD4